MAKGQISKDKIVEKIMEIFPDAFIHEKVLRIPMEENGDQIEIKCTLTAAKDLVKKAAVAFSSESTGLDESMPLPWNNIPEDNKITKEEEENIENLAKLLGF